MEGTVVLNGPGSDLFSKYTLWIYYLDFIILTSNFLINKNLISDHFQHKLHIITYGKHLLQDCCSTLPNKQATKCVVWSMFDGIRFLPCCQTVTEKHKLNVPETMTEVLDVSDEEGESRSTLEPVINPQCSPPIERVLSGV